MQVTPVQTVTIPSPARNRAIDVAKGVGIFLVVYGHTVKGTEFRTFLYAFHMPLFFVVSGLFFRPTIYASWPNFLKRTGRSLLLPYVTFYGISYAYWLGIERMLRPGSEQITWYEPLIGLVLATDIGDYMNPNGALWFLVGLFVAQAALYGLVRTIRSEQWLLVILCLSALVGFWLADFRQLILPWSLKSAFVALFFVGLGYLVRNVNYVPPQRIGQVGLCLTLFGLCYGLSADNGLIDIDHGRYGNPIIFLSAALAGVWGCLCGATLIRNAGVLAYFGVNSLIAFGLSEPVKRLCIGIVAKLSQQSVPMVRQSAAHSLLVVLLTLIVLVPITYVFTHQLSGLLGRKHKN